MSERSAHNFVNLVGQKFGLITVIERKPPSIHGAVLWKCKCECGSIRWFRSNNLKRGTKTHRFCHRGYVEEQDENGQRIERRLSVERDIAKANKSASYHRERERVRKIAEAEIFEALREEGVEESIARRQAREQSIARRRDEVRRRWATDAVPGPHHLPASGRDSEDTGGHRQA